jgi:acetyl-CoA carboxylase biotin carboxylase subunit
MKSIKCLLIANRGEIAVRIIRAARALGIKSVAIFSDADEGALHVRLADRAIALRGSSARESYLNREKVLNAAIQCGADAVHPGYGFFAENAAFADAVQKEGIIFVGPEVEAISAMGDKGKARALVAEHGVPIVPGTRVGLSVKELGKEAGRIGFPVLVKAVAGGSGRGMRLVERKEDLESKIAEAAREAEAAFGNGEVIIEKYLARPRHIEVQIFGDQHGHIVHFGERECSLQRRHQKVIEESPAPNLNPALRERICTAAVAAARAVNYSNAGTIEFLVEGGSDASDNFYFLEMNTRIQVEHPVTEIVHGIDLVKLQVLVAQGLPLPLEQERIVSRGHAIEFRVSAEDPRNNFSPTTGKLRYLHIPAGPGIREDGWIEPGTQITPYYDSLLSKLIVSGSNRKEALAAARVALHEMVVEGVPTTLGFHRWMLEQPDFQNGDLDVKWIERNYQGQVQEQSCVGPFILPPLKNAAAEDKK